MTGRDKRPHRSYGKTGGAAPESTTHLIGGSVDAYLASQGISSVTSLARIIECWPNIVGDQVAAHASPVKVVGNELLIMVDHPAWATELRLLAQRIISQLENELKAPVVGALKVHVRG